MELLAGLLGLALFVLIVRCRSLPYLIRVFTLSSGVVAYAILQALYARHAFSGEILKIPGSEERFGFIVVACILIGLLARLIVFPFSRSDRLHLFHQLGTPLPSPTTHLLVWIAGSVVYRLVSVTPSPVLGGFALSRMDLPLLLYASVASSAFVLWKLREEYLREKHGGALPRREGEKSVAAEEDGEEHVLRLKIEHLQEEAVKAEQRWAAAVLHERAARILAERSAREFAEARRQRNAPMASPQPLTVGDALTILDLAPQYDAIQAREAYHALIRQYHPDKVSALGPHLRETAERETKKINAAYSMVVQELKRKQLTAAYTSSNPLSSAT